MVSDLPMMLISWSIGLEICCTTIQSQALWTKLRDVLQDNNCLVTSSILHLTDLLPGVVLVVPQDILQKIIVIVVSSCKYIVIS